jgi:multiple sugar transport system substrate-binding protein
VGAVGVALGAPGIAEGKAGVRASASQVKTAPTLAQSRGARGTVTLCTGTVPPDVARGFNRKYRAQKLRLRIVGFEGAPHDEAVRLQRSRRCDLIDLDVIFTAEFAAQRGLLDVTALVKPRRDEFIASTLSTARYRGRYWAVPHTTDAGLLYYRTDRIAAVPDTWQGVYDAARLNGGIVYQGQSYEGLTCDFLELAFAAGGSVLSADGKRSAINSPENLRALHFMVDGIRTGAAPSVVTFFDEYGTAPRGFLL